MTELFGTNGIRGIANKDMNGAFALHIAQAWGTYLKKQTKKPHIALATDARISNAMLKHAIISGFQSTGCNVIDYGMIPTPTLQYMVKQKNHDSGVMITASHNPPQFNGIKGISSDGTEFPKDIEEEIEHHYFSQNYSIVQFEKIGSYTNNNQAISTHIQGILKNINTTAIKKHQFHVLLDCGNGAACPIAPKLLKKLHCKVTTINCTPDGLFSGRPSEPLEKNLSTLIEAVKNHKVHFGVAVDGDADRAIFIDENGRYLMGDISLTIIGKHIAQQQPKSIFVTPVTTSTVFEDCIKKEKSEVIYTKVGSPIVARKMIEKAAIFGGEENGGLIFSELQYCRDSLMTIVKMLEILATQPKTLSNLADELPIYYTEKTKIKCPNEKKASVMEKLKKIQNNSADIIDIITIDGIKLTTTGGWVLIRPSGTEPIIRIFSEAKTPDQAKIFVDHYVKIVKEFV